VRSGRRNLRYKRKRKTIYEANSAIAIASFTNGTSAALGCVRSITGLCPLRSKVFFFKLRH